MLVEHGHDISGTTAQRPTNAEVGQRFFDTTIGRGVVYNGSTWQASSDVAPSTGTGTAGLANALAAGAGTTGTTTTAGGAGGAASLTAGAGGAKTGTGAAAGGAGGASTLTAGAGGATASSGSDAGGAGGGVTLTAGAGGAASAGTGNGGAGGNVNLVPGAGGASAGGTAGAAGEIQFNGGGCDFAKYGMGGLATPTATNCTFFLATRAYRVKSVSAIWDVAAGGVSTIDVIKDTGTNAIAGGTSILAAALSINTTARTVANPSLAASAATLLLAAGNRLSLKYNHAIQSTAGLFVQVQLAPM